MGGAATYLKNVLPELVQQLRSSGAPSYILLWHSGLAHADSPWAKDIDLREVGRSDKPLIPATNPLSRLWFDQVEMPRSAKQEKLDAVFATANYCSLRPACRQILLVRNPVPFDEVYLSRMPRRVRASFAFQRILTIRSMAAAEVVLFPTAAMRDLAARWTDGVRDHWRVAHYGALHSRFKPSLAGTLSSNPGSGTKLLHVSTYSDQKNIGVLLEALEVLRTRGADEITLRLTAGFDKAWIGDSPIFPNFKADAARYKALAARGAADDVSWMPYEDLPGLYRSSDIFVFPSYTESFGHPLVEAMASGLPIISADTPVNRELCGDAAIYVPPFAPAAFADAIQNLAGDAKERARLSNLSIRRARAFTWPSHVERIIQALRER